MNETTVCMKKTCGTSVHNNDVHTVTISDGRMYLLCPDCAESLHRHICGNVDKMLQQSMPLKEINRMLKEQASRYAEERFMTMGFPQRLALPGVMA